MKYLRYLVMAALAGYAIGSFIRRNRRPVPLPPRCPSPIPPTPACPPVIPVNPPSAEHLAQRRRRQGSVRLERPCLRGQFRPLKTRKETRANFSVDHVLVSLEWPIHQVIDHTRHWSALLSNQRQGLWDGLLKIELNTIDDDAEAFAHLESVKKP